MKVSGGLCNLDGCYSVHRPSPCPACPSIPVILPPSVRSSAIWGLSIPPTAPAATATIRLFRPVSGPSDRSFRSSADIWPLFLLLSSPSLAGTLLLRPLLRRVLWSSPSSGRRQVSSSSLSACLVIAASSSRLFGRSLTAALSQLVLLWSLSNCRLFAAIVRTPLL